MKFTLKQRGRILLRCGAAALALSLVFAGCSPKGEGPNKETENNTPVAMGRYTETKQNLPEGLGQVASFCKNKEGQLEIVYNKDKGRYVGPWYMAVSQDNGATWQEKDAPWLQEISASSLSMLSYNSATGGYTVQMNELPEGFSEMTTEELTALMGSGWTPTTKLLYVDSEGNATQSQEELPSDESGISANSLVTAENGDVFTNHIMSIVQWDSAMQTPKFTYSNPAMGTITSYCVVKDRLYIACGGDILQYNIATGEKLENFATSSQEKETDNVYTSAARFGDCILSYEPQSNTIFYCDTSGIYCRKIGGSAVEKLVDGQFTSLNMPSEAPQNLIANQDGSCLVLLYGEEFSLVFYAYDKTVPTVPSTELKVYSLEENKTVRQAMSLYQRSHPDVRVNYQVGLSSGVTQSDALRTLSTEILSGQGPDVLILDNMPLQSYMEKGVLMDLTNLPMVEELLKNTAQSVQKDGKIYALPARFSIPVLVAESGANITDLPSLAQAVGQWQAAHPNMPGLEADLKTPAWMMNCLYATCAPAWFTPNGSLDTEAFIHFLENVKTITNTYAAEERGFGVGGYITDLGYGSVSFYGGSLGFCLSEARSFKDLALVDAAITQKRTGELTPLPGQVQGVFIPKVIAGINAATSQEEAAKEFLATLLSQPVQDHDFGDGFPTNAASFEKQSQNPYPDYDDGMYISVNDGAGHAYELQAKWPQEAFLTQFKSMAQGLTNPQTVNPDIMDILLAETPAYFSGEKTAEETANAVAQKVQLYLSE